MYAERINENSYIFYIYQMNSKKKYKYIQIENFIFEFIYIYLEELFWHLNSNNLHQI